MKPIEILVVEDNPCDVWMIRHAVADEAGPLSIRVASNGSEAALTSVEHPADLVILDTSVAAESVITTLHRSRVPIVVFTSVIPPDRQRWLELGVREFVQKPCDLDEYRRVVSQIVRRWTSHGALQASTGS